ncbi:hypothetical protein Tco_1311224 [Tanacetum coccineum]
MWPANPLFSQDSKSSPDGGFKPSGEEEKKDAEDPENESGNLTEGKDSKAPSNKEPRINQEKDDNINSTNNVNAVSSTVNTSKKVIQALKDPSWLEAMQEELLQFKLQQILKRSTKVGLWNLKESPFGFVVHILTLTNQELRLDGKSKIGAASNLKNPVISLKAQSTMRLVIHLIIDPNEKKLTHMDKDTHRLECLQIAALQPFDD